MYVVLIFIQLMIKLWNFAKIFRTYLQIHSNIELNFRFFWLSIFSHSHNWLVKVTCIWTRCTVFTHCILLTLTMFTDCILLTLTMLTDCILKTLMPLSSLPVRLLSHWPTITYIWKTWLCLSLSSVNLDISPWPWALT